MTDIASLALQIDSREVSQGVSELDNLTRAGARSEQAAQGMQRAFSRTSASAGQQRAAMQQLSYQIGDVAQGFAMGVNPMVLFAQQGGQVVQALSLMRGGAGGLIGFLAGPWGAVLTGAAMILGTMASKLGDTTSALEDVKFSSYAVGDAQKILGGVMDMTTGKINTQIPALLALARAQILVARVQSQARQAQARQGVVDIQDRGPVFGGGFGGGLYIGRRKEDARDYISRQVLGGVMDANTAVQRLENLRNAGRLTAEEFATAAASVANFAVETENLKVFDSAEKLLNGTGGRELLKTGKTHKSVKRALSEAEKDYKEFSEGAAKIMQNAFAEASVFGGKSANGTYARAAAEGMAQIMADVRKEQEANLKTSYENAEATAQWRDNINGVVAGLRSAGGLAGNIGGAIETLGKLGSGDFKNIGGAAGYLLNKYSGMQVGTNKDGTIQTLGDRIEKIFDKDGTFAKTMGGILGEAGSGAALGSLIFGSGNKGAQIGGALGGVGGYLIGGPIGGLIGSLGGAIVGGVVNEIKPNLTAGIIGGLLLGPIGAFLAAFGLGSAKYGTANVTGLKTSTVAGNNKNYKNNAQTGANNIQEALSQVADALGGDVGSFNVSIGQYKGKWRVSPGGMTGKLNKGDTVDFGKDGAEAAMLFAIADAIKDGAITGIRASVQTLLSASGDVEKQLAKALKFQGVFDELQKETDPMAYSLGQVAKEAAALNKIFAEAGATTEEYAQLEQLLAFKRTQAAEQARKDIVDKIKDPYDLQIQILELLGKSEDALAASRLIELAGLKDGLQPLQAWVYQLQDARKIIDQFQPLADDLKKYREELLGGGKAQSFGFLAAQFRATAIAAGNGDATGLGNLRGAASSFLDAAKENASTALEYQRAQAEVMRAVDKGIFAAETQVDYAQAQIDAINNSANILEAMRAEMAQFQAQITENTGLTSRILQRFDGNTGLLIATTQDEPVEVRVVS